MVLWTIQPSEVYAAIETEGIYRCDSRRVDMLESFFGESYRWLVKQMREKIGNPPDGVEYPVWAWYKRNGRRHRPDLRRTGFGTRGDKLVCMEIDIPDNQVVLSDFDAWHFVLNKIYLDDSTNETEWNANNAAFDALPPEQKQEAMEKSWNRIFDIEPVDNGWARRGFYVQATFWELRREQIKTIQPFTCR